MKITPISKGSEWRKWDLHVHTPDSLINGYTGEDVWEEYLKDLESLPPEFKVLGINDYIFIDGYRRLREEKKKGRLKNIDLLLPVIELRIDKFGGSKSHFSRVNYHVIFSDEIDPDIIQAQFLNALPTKYILSPEYEHFRTGGKWNALATKKSLEDLGNLIIGSVPAEKRKDFGSPIVEGFNNLCFKLDDIREVLESHYFQEKTMTAVGKTEWADIKWNDNTIADKKTIINGANWVFISGANVGVCQKAKNSLTESQVNDRLLDCSDAHVFQAKTENKDRLGKCFTWIKGDPTFEGLRQAFFEFDGRVHIGDNAPLDPPLTIKSVTITFPANAKIGNDDFCFRGTHTVNLSPNLTCIIGGRGTGKSMLLNLIHEKLYPGQNRFFKDNSISSDKRLDVSTCVSIDGDSEQKVIEFLSQNEVVEFALNQDRFTTAIFSRLTKLDSKNVLADSSKKLQTHLSDIDEQIKRIRSRATLEQSIEAAKKELQTNRNLIASLESQDYKNISNDLSTKTKALQVLQSSKQSLADLIGELQTIMDNRVPLADKAQNIYDELIEEIYTAIQTNINKSKDEARFTESNALEIKLESDVAALKVQLDDYLRKQGLSNENLLDIGRANKRIAELEEKIRLDEAQSKKVLEKIEAFSFNAKLKNNYDEAIISQLEPINLRLKALNGEVKPIELKYDYDFEKAKVALVDAILALLPHEETSRAIRNDHLASVLFQVMPDKVESLAHNKFLEILSSEKQQRKTGEVLGRYFTDKTNYEIYKLLIKRVFSDVDQYKQIIVSYDSKPLQNSSFGQRCTAAIVVLLLLGNTPIIIDEPEAHLDSSLIANYLVDLVKGTKRQRQIIFATHNANFVINGDAELIHVLSMDATHRTTITPTTIENLDHREKLLSLEGGKKAFLQRERRYHFSRE